MAAWGTGVPKLYLYDHRGTLRYDIELPDPARYEQKFEMEKDTQVSVNRKLIKRLFGFRYKGTFTWEQPDSTSQDAIFTIVNWTGKIRLWPHKEVTQLSYMVEVTGFEHENISGKVAMDRFRVEFTATELLNKVPNPEELYVVKGISNTVIV